MSEDKEISSWRDKTAPEALYFYKAVKERNKSDDKTELWKKYRHRMGNLANILVKPVLEGADKKEQVKIFKKQLKKKTEKDLNIVPLLRELLPEGF